MPQYKGAIGRDELLPNRQRKDTRQFRQKWSDFFNSADGVVLFTFLLPIAALATMTLPLSGEIIVLVVWLFYRSYVRTEGRHFDFPYRVPIQAGVGDGSVLKGGIGKGITYAGNDIETKEQIYLGDSDLRTHMLVLGTTGSGKTEFLLGLVANALVQNTGFIYVDGKGDPKLQKEVFRLARLVGREDDLSIINFITSGRDFVNKQDDKVTNNMNMMGNTSSGMLIELIVALMDDSGGGGDMWKGRAISFVAALTRPLVYMRDMGYINLSPDKFLDYFELPELEEMVFNHNGKFGDNFDFIVAPLRSYLLTLPGYQKTKLKKQETKTLEQHGFIVMQLTRIFNDLNFNYGHIFKTKVGDVDFFDVVINRRCLTVLLPALERAPDSMRMLGKMIVGSIKQMMAGCLGNRVEGVVREIIDSRPTNAKFPFYTILDEYGYYAVIGFAVAPAQARSLGFSVIFAAQDFSSLKKSSAEEADATWENTNMRACGRITSGVKSDTWERINGAAGEAMVASLGGFQREQGELSEKFYQQENVNITQKGRLSYDDLAQQADGEFHFIIGKKSDAGLRGGVRVIRGMGFYTASQAPKEMRINDFIPVEPPEIAELPKNLEALARFYTSLSNGSFVKALEAQREGSSDPILNGFRRIFEANAQRPALSRKSRLTIGNIAMGWFMGEQPSLDSLPEITGATTTSAVVSAMPSIASATAPSAPAGATVMAALDDLVVGNSDAADPIPTIPDVTPSFDVPSESEQLPPAPVSSPEVQAMLLAATTDILKTVPVGTVPGEAERRLVISVDDDNDLAIGVGRTSTTNVIVAAEESRAFSDLILPLLRSVVLPDGHQVAPAFDEWEDYKVDVPKDLYTIEVLARPGIKSLHEKWALEERVQQLEGKMAEVTAYAAEPTPKALPLSEGYDLLGLISSVADAKPARAEYMLNVAPQQPESSQDDTGDDEV